MSLTPFHILFFVITLLLWSSAEGQNDINDSFHITGKIIGKDSGIVVLFYSNPKYKTYRDTSKLVKGNFKFNGRVNRVSDAHLWTDTSNHNFSDKSVVRFLLEPGNIEIVYDHGLGTIKGSAVQAEKEHFDLMKSNFLIPENRYQNEIDSLFLISHNKPDSATRLRIDLLYAKIALIREAIKPIDKEYIRSHPNSYLSAFLLYTYTRHLPLDTLQVYYSLLGRDAQESSEGKKVIEYIYPLTNDISFRNRFPFQGLKFNENLNNVHSVHDIKITNSNQHLISLGSFKGKYLLIDFWASWCGPCVKEIPYLKKLKVIYKDDPIRFVSVSVDSDTSEWKKAMIKYNFIVDQFIETNGFKGLLPIYCKVVTGIPRYVLVGRSGEIISYDTPHPSSAELRRLINGILGK